MYVRIFLNELLQYSTCSNAIDVHSNGITVMIEVLLLLLIFELRNNHVFEYLVEVTLIILKKQKH